MRRTASLLFNGFVALLLTIGLFGCDNSPTSVEDIEVQPGTEISASSLSLVLTESESTTQFEITYQGLEGVPSATGTGVLTLTKASEMGSPEQGEQQWTVGAEGSVSGVVQETVVVRYPTSDGEVVDSLPVNVSPFVVTSDFSSGFIAAADYEDAQRDSSASGGTTITLQQDENNENNPVGSNGISYLEVDASGSGAVTFERRASAPNSDRFTFLVRPASTDFNLTLTFTEETGGGTTEHEITVPVNAGNQWLKYGIAFSQISQDFNPVAQRAGGNGPLTKVEFSADADVTYAVDELMLATANATQVEIMDFERTTGAYGPPFCPPSFSNSDMVATDSDGFTSRSVEGEGCFGYNYGGGLGPPTNVFLDVDGSDVVSFKANASPGDSLTVFVETANGDGGYSTDNSKTVALPSGSWGTVEVPLSMLGENPNALQNTGIRNFGFTAVGESPDILIDDIKIKAPSEN
jgi:hypothetical protein